MHAMAYDSARGVTVLFGGIDDNPHDVGDTWEWDGTSWTMRATSGPSARYWSAMAYDTYEGRTVLFGGCHWRLIGGPLPRGGTWSWDGTTWTQPGVSGPSARYTHAMAYDSARRVSVLFGGRDAWYSWIDQTWELGRQPRGACCEPDALCTVLARVDCEQDPLNTYQGDDTACVESKLQVGTCHDGVDNDCDGAVDCDDPDCLLLFGDIVPNSCPPDCSQPDLDDITCVLDDFADGPAVVGCGTNEPLDSTDLSPCDGNGVLDLDDILAVLDAFGQVFACPHLCP